MGAATTTGSAATAGEGLAAARASAGLPGLADDAGLDAVATRHALEMATAGQLLHSQLSTLTAGVVDHPQRVAENVGVGYSADDVMTAFLASPEHRGNILGDFDATGTGVAVGADGRVWVTEVFVKLPAVATATFAMAAATVPLTASTTTAAAAPVVAAAPKTTARRQPARHRRPRRHRVVRFRLQ
ncbi:MAG TPA: CAP domain-containing protein [Acidimicrobiales bacterium]|nr:CAP domain-containing protein [Acidimicrobiales bacterium]